MEEIINKLKMSLTEKSPALLLGAGFSVGTKNMRNEDLLIGTGLLEKLYDELYVNNPPTLEMFEEDNDAAIRYKESGNLKGLCSLLTQEGRRAERNNVITNCFLGAHVDSTKFHYFLSGYKWDRIFTLNVDDLVENIYDENNIPLTVWCQEKSDRRNNNSNTVLIKLHGSVLAPEKGYIFDDEEYANFTNEASYLLRDFGDAYVKGDMIFLGTEFQEEDLKQIINLYEMSGYSTEANNYFFICKQINDPILRRKIKEKPNYYFLKWTTEQFLEFLYDNINTPKTIKEELLGKGMVVWNDYQKRVDFSYRSKLYTGCEPRFEDFILDWDIEHPGLYEYLKKIDSYKTPVVAAIIGKNYVGKTCFALRVLNELNKREYYAVKFEMKSSEYMYLFLEYMKTFPDGTKVAVLFEDAAFYYNILYPILMKQCPTNIKKFVIISTEIKRNYYIRRNILQSNNAVIQFKIDLGISWTYANNIYNKLQEKTWLNRPEVHGSTESEIKRYAVETNDIIEFLYNITNGRGFEEHYQDLIMCSKNNECNLKYLQMMSLLSALGITQIPKRIFPQLLIEYRRRFNIGSFLKSYEEIVLSDRTYLKLRCQRLVQNILLNGLLPNERREIIVAVAKQVTGQFNEGDINEWSEIYQKVLSVKALLGENIMGISDIQDVLKEIEETSKKYSYYWIQRGLAAQRIYEYDLAENYFRAAIGVRNRSYQAHHALAKNLMERSLDLLEKGNGYAPYYMEEGEKEIKKIIENPAFSRGLVYSLHTYMDMKIKYCLKSDIILSNDTIEYMVNHIITIPRNTMDSYMNEIIDEFIAYVKSKGMESAIQRLLQHDFGELQDGCEDEYKIENLDICW